MVEYTPEELRAGHKRTAHFHVVRALRYVEIGHLGLAMDNLRQAVRYLEVAEELLPTTISNQDAVRRAMDG